MSSTTSLAAAAAADSSSLHHHQQYYPPPPPRRHHNHHRHHYGSSSRRADNVAAAARRHEHHYTAAAAASRLPPPPSDRYYRGDYGYLPPHQQQQHQHYQQWQQHQKPPPPPQSSFVVSSPPLRCRNNTASAAAIKDIGGSRADGHLFPLEKPWELLYGKDWQTISPVYEIRTIADFWGIFNNVGVPSSAPIKCDFYLFHSHISPKWEDINNFGGGKWNIDLGQDRSGADAVWLRVLMGLVGEQYSSSSSGSRKKTTTPQEDNDATAAAAVAQEKQQQQQRRQQREPINGVSLHVRPGGVRCSVWTREGSPEMQQAVGDTIRRAADVPKSMKMEFKWHSDSIINHSSFNSETAMIA